MSSRCEHLPVLSLLFMGSGGRWRRPLSFMLLQEKALGRKVSMELRPLVKFSSQGQTIPEKWAWMEPQA